MKYRGYIRSFFALIIPLVLVWIAFQPLMKAPGSYFFASGGDGLKSYYGSYYHLKYDQDYLHSNSQNYPYGESVFYGDSQPFITNILILLKRAGLDLSDDLIGIINLTMLLSIVLGAFFMYFLLRKLGLPFLYSIAVSCIVIFLSPQIDRLGGHFSLSYVFMLPLFFLIYYGFYEKPTFIRSLFIGLLVFAGLGLQAYYFAFFGLIIIFILLVKAINNADNFRFYPDFVIHISLQLLIPYLIFSTMSMGYPSDRTSYPWGFFETRAFFESVFLPSGKPYVPFLNLHYLKWEGISFIGMVAVIGSGIGFWAYCRKIRRDPFSLHSHPYINVLLWISIIALFFSFAYPFALGMKSLWNYMGPLKQFRASGRFAWIFYYAINIAVYYSIWKWYEKHRNVPYLSVVVGLALAWGAYDAFLFAKGRGTGLANEIPELKDMDNSLPVNKWLHNIDIDEYQAIISLPYYHIGSEAYWIDGSGNSVKDAFIASWKTGLPVINVMLSRTPIGQSVKNLALKWEPLQEYEILRDFHDERDILLMVQKNEVTDENELRLIEYSDHVAENDRFYTYRLSFKAFETLRSDFAASVKEEIKDMQERDGLLVSDAEKDFIFLSYGDGIEYPGGKVLDFNPRKAEVILDTVLFNDASAIKISFWMKGLSKDLIPRTRLILNYVNSEGNFEEVYNNDIFRIVKFVDKAGWGLIEIEHRPKTPGEKLRIYMTNNLMTSGKSSIDNILIRPASLDVYYKGSDFVFKNNRFIR
jgi:hypothetical protein